MITAVTLCPELSLTLPHALSCPAEFGPGTKGLLDSENASWLIKQYFKDSQDAQDHRFAVIRADLKGLPPATVVTCEVDPIRDEGQAYAEKLKVTDCSLPAMCSQTYTMDGMHCLSLDAGPKTTTSKDPPSATVITCNIDPFCDEGTCVS